jgi:DNA-binding transcriptional regulator YiaG
MFGDQSAFAEAMGVNRSAISRWKQVGEIPHRHWEQLLRIARERKLPITFKDISGFNPSDL